VKRQFFGFGDHVHIRAREDVEGDDPTIFAGHVA
jgi:hypothetical protein